MTMNSDQIDALVAAALEVQKNAYAPYSRFMVGAAIMAADGAIYSGCNVENASYGLGVCAERSAVSVMISQGQHKIIGVAVTSQGGVSPCGACRQTLAEFGMNFDVILVDSETSQITRTWRMGDLLPGAFRKEHLD